MQNQRLLRKQQYWDGCKVWIQNKHLLLCKFALWLKVNTRHDDVIKWKHCPRNLPFVRAIRQSPVDSPYYSKYSSYKIWILPTRVWNYAIGKHGNRRVIFQYYVRCVVYTMLKNTSECFPSHEHLSNCQVRWTVGAQNTMGVVNVSITR